MTQYGPYPPQQPHQQYPYHYPPPQPAPRKGMPVWGWVLIVLGGLGMLMLFSCGGLLWYLGTYGPETYVYTGREVPQRYVDTMRNLEILEEGEQVLFFYSDALVDIRDGLYFVSDRKVGIYVRDWAVPKALVLFNDIADAQLDRDTSFFSDSTITLELKDGEWISFPVSSEKNRDQQFFQAIQQRMDESRS